MGSASSGACPNAPAARAATTAAVTSAGCAPTTAYAWPVAAMADTPQIDVPTPMRVASRAGNASAWPSSATPRLLYSNEAPGSLAS